MTDLLSIGASGIKAYTRALGTVGDNIANSQTEGYVRRGVRIQEVPTASTVTLSRNQLSPGGVVATGVTRAVDEWLVEDARVAASDAGRTSSRLNWLEVSERTLGDDSGSVGVSMTNLFNAADELATDPGNTGLRAAYLQAADDVATGFRRTAGGLESVAGGLATDATNTVAQLNTNLTALERVNDGLRRARGDSTNQAALLDERDRLLDRIGETVAVEAEFDARGVTTLRLSPPSGDPLVAGGAAGQVSVAVATDGTLGFSLTPSSAANFIPVSGKLSGLADAARDIAGRRTSLDGLAVQFGNDLNTANQAGLDAQGNPGVALFDLTGGNAASFTLRALTPGDIAAADATSDNGNLLSMASLRGPSGGEAGWAALVGSQALATASARAQDSAATTRFDGAQAARADVSEVDLDNEAAELLRFQQAYEGSARVIQVARETLQSILNIF